MQPHHRVEDRDGGAGRRRRVRRAVVMLLVALLLLVGGMLLLSVGAPEWQPDGSRERYPFLVRVLVCASLIAGTMLVPIGLRRLLLALVPSKSLGVVLAALVGLFGLVAVPLEIWMGVALTRGLEPGSQERQDSGDGDWDWD
jgi:cell division protein FtsW (lipid II flippase)